MLPRCWLLHVTKPSVSGVIELYILIFLPIKTLYLFYNGAMLIF